MTRPGISKIVRRPHTYGMASHAPDPEALHKAVSEAVQRLIDALANWRLRPVLFFATFVDGTNGRD
jgi:hypothetical protein